MPGGIAFIFVYTSSQSTIDRGNFKFMIDSSAFLLTMANTQRENSKVAVNKGGWTVGFLEKTITDWWSKFVIVVR